MSKLNKIKKQKKDLLDQLNKLNIEEKEHLSKKLIKCVHCKKRSRIDKLIYLQHHWYTEPHGCTGGDYWNEGEGGFICPKCNNHNRSYHLPDITPLKYSFQCIRKVYDKYAFPSYKTTFKNKILILGKQVTDDWKEMLK